MRPYLRVLCEPFVSFVVGGFAFPISCDLSRRSRGSRCDLSRRAVDHARPRAIPWFPGLSQKRDKARPPETVVRDGNWKGCASRDPRMYAGVVAAGWLDARLH